MPLIVRTPAPRHPLKTAAKAVLERTPRVLSWVLWARRQFNIWTAPTSRKLCGTYIGVTGSCGKSSTTHLIGRLLSGDGTVRAAIHQNSPGGVFMALSELKEPTDYFVQEISGDQPGRLESVARVVKPDVAVVTAVGHDHFTNFKQAIEDRPSDRPVGERLLAAIAEEKGTLVAALSEDGVACLNADQHHVRSMAQRCRGRVILFGRSPESDIRAENVASGWPDRLSFDLAVADWRQRVQTQFVGTVALHSVLAALAAVEAVGGDVRRAAAELSLVEPARFRGSVHQGTDGHTYLLDTVKAPLWQVEMLVEDLPNLSAKGIVFVLGEVSDVRNDKSKTYRRLLRRASEVAEHVVGFGPAASNAHKVRAEGRDNVAGLETYDQAIQYLSGLPPRLVVLKSSTGVQMHRIWEAVSQGSGAQRTGPPPTRTPGE